MTQFTSPTATPQPAQIQPANHEWQGSLGRATGEGALFSLYLAIQMQPGAPAARFETTPAPTFDETAFLTSLNHYRRAPTSAQPASLSTVGVYSQLTQTQDMATLSLWRAMHPDPLAIADNPTRLEPQVVANCSLATQLKLRENHRDAAWQCDETQLDDIITGSASLLSA